MHTKRLLRQLVSHGGLAYALLGFFGGLLWLSLTAASGGLTVTPQPLAAPSDGRVSLQEAIDSVRRFVGQPTLVLEGGMQADAEAGRRGDLFYLEGVSPTRGEDFFKVDARTGEVVEATIRSRVAPGEQTANLSQPAAQARAERFARTHFWGFDGLTLVDRSVRTSPDGTVYSFKWTALAPQSRAELPTSVSLAVAGRSGEVFWYLSQRDPIQIDTLPAVEQARAVDVARGWLQTRDQRWDLTTPTAVRLQVLYDDDDRQQLVWSVQYRSATDGARSSVRLLIDAQTGAVIQTG
ncbi:MAG: PepSY domain-containing protein [Chloroflexi bacterium]|nr:PepSY domain-containing protein [Chloroflexota bacterium]